MVDRKPAHQRVLAVVSHRAELSQYLCDALETSPYQVVLLKDIAEIGKTSFAGLIVDSEIGLPALKRINAQRSPTTPFLTIVDSKDPNFIDSVLATGVDDVISTPIYAPVLLRRLENLLLGRGNYPDRTIDTSLLETVELFQALFTHSPDAVLILNAKDMMIVDCNEVCCRMNGYTRDELIGRSVDILNYEKAPDDTPEAYIALLKSAGQLHYEVEHVRKDGTRFSVEVSTCLITVAGRDLILGIDRDITERKQAEAALKESEERYRLLTQYATDVITRHSVSGEILFASPASESMLGYKPEELVGTSAYDLVHPSERDDLIAYHKSLPKELSSYTETSRLRRRDGQYVWFETTASRIRNPDTGLIENIVCVTRDISDRKAAESIAQEQLTLADALSDAASLLKRTVKTDEALTGILEQAARVVPYDSASIALIDGDFVRVVGCRGFAERGLEELALSTSFRISERPGFYVPLLENKQPLIIDDVHDYPDWIMPPGTEWIHGNLSVPVVAQDKVIGLFHLDSAVPGAFTLEQARHLQMFADQVAIAIQSAQLYDELRALYHATSFLFASFDADDLTDIARQITSVVVQEFGKVDCGLLILEPETGNLPLMARAGEYRAQGHDPVHTDGFGLIATAVRTAECIYAPDVRQDERYLNMDDRTLSELVIPLCAGGEVIGALDLQSPELDAFTPQDQRILRAFGERAAVAIQNLQYANELEARVVERTNELRHTKEQVEAILNNSSDAILVTHMNGTVRRVNPAFSVMFGYDPRQCLEQPVLHLVASRDQNLLSLALDAAIMDSRPGRIEIAMCRKDGSQFDADVVLSPILENEHHSLGVICTVRDITERKQIETELRKALEKERELSELKTRFVSMASHEFRTPLTMIMTASELLQNYLHRMTDDQRNERLQRIQAEVKNMARLIDDVLTVSRTPQDASLEFDPQPLNIVDFCSGLIDEQRAMAKSGHQFELSTEGDYIEVALDRKILRDILVNLLSNAVKYSQPNTVIELKLICHKSQILLIIEDQGIGIPDIDQKRLFEAFHRGGNVGAISGTGLGLTIAKQAVELHGGTIRFQSQIGKGTTFTVAIPTTLVEDGNYDHEDFSH